MREKEDIQELKESLRQLQQIVLSHERALGLIREDTIPASVFCTELGALESIVVYLRELHQLSYVNIGKKLSRSAAVIGVVYRTARKKYQQPLSVTSAVAVPVAIFADRSVSMQRHLVRYLHDQRKMQFCDIARLIHRNPRTVWTAYHARGDKQ